MQEVKKIKCASGFGDSIYMYPITRYLLKQNRKLNLIVMTDYKDIYKCHPYRERIEFVKHSKDFANFKISYCGRKYKSGTSQFEDVCIAAEVPKDIKYNIDWKIQNKELIDNIKKLSSGKPICVVSAPFKPFGRVDEFGKELTVNFKRMNDLIARNKNDYYFIQTCKNTPEYILNNINLNLAGKTAISDVLDIMSIANRSVGQIGHILPLSEVFKVPCMLFFSRRGINCENRFISSITYEKVVHYKKLVSFCVDDFSDVEIDRKWHEMS